jgi:hypothetical protein
MRNLVNFNLEICKKWFSNSDFYGYDPYDFRGSDKYVRLFGHQNFIFKKIRGFLSVLEYNIPPRLLRRVFRIKTSVNPKGLGLLASSYLSLYRTTLDINYLEKTNHVLDWLYNNANSNYIGYSWGYPFHWQSRIFFEKGTPSSVATGTIGDAFLDHYIISNSARSLKVCEGIAQFFLNCLNRHYNNDRNFCFSYTPIDNFKVHNASLFVAAFLARFGKVINNQIFIDTALQVTQYTLSEQNEDGSFNYWSNEPKSLIDHYHTGFVLRHLDTVQKSVPRQSFIENINRGYHFYRNNLFHKSGIPMFSTKSIYPIDVHSCAEAILCLNQFDDNPLSDQLLRSVLNFIQENMISKNGYYIAGIRNRFWGDQKIDIPYMRWGQCWMFLAFAKLFEKINKI